MQLAGQLEHAGPPTFYIQNTGPNGELEWHLVKKVDAYLYLGCRIIQPRLPFGRQTGRREVAAMARIVEVTNAALATLRNRAVAAENRFRAACEEVRAGAPERARNFVTFVGSVMDQATAAMELNGEQLRRMDGHERYLRKKAGCAEGHYLTFSARWARRRRTMLLEFRAGANSWKRKMAWRVKMEA